MVETDYYTFTIAYDVWQVNFWPSCLFLIYFFHMVLKVTHFETTSITITHIVHGLFSLPSHTSVSLAYPMVIPAYTRYETQLVSLQNVSVFFDYTTSVGTLWSMRFGAYFCTNILWAIV